MIRRYALLALALLLSACGARGERDPFTDSRIPPALGPAYWPPYGWAWGLIQVRASPPQRYGVAAPLGQPALAQVLMLPGYGGLAEEDFPAANAMIGRRIQVWALDGVGQGGSGRIALPRDIGHVDSFEGDIEGVQQMLAQVIRPSPDAPLVAIADRTAAPVLLRALQRGLPGVAAVVLTQPRLGQGVHVAAPTTLARWLRLDRYRAPGEAPWRRDAVNAPPGSPAFVRHAWQLANPDLRMGGPSLGWRAAFDDLTAAVDAEGVRRLGLPVLILADPDGPIADRRKAARLCRALPHCAQALVPAGQWPAREVGFVADVAASAALPITPRGR